MNGTTNSKSDMVITVEPYASSLQSESEYERYAKIPAAIIPKWINVNITQLTIMIFIDVYITKK